MSTQTISPSENQTAELAVLIDELTARLQAGEPVDMAQVMLEHADYADELAELLPAIMQLVNLSGSNSASQPSPCAVGESFPELADFRILREIGRGGMGIVYEAVQVSLGRRVALKVLPRAATMDPRQLERFKNEAKAVASLRHEHIVHVYGVGCEQGVHYYSMEFVDGQTLAQHIRSVQVGGERPAAGGDATLDHIPGKKTPTHPSTTISTERSGSRQRDFYRTSATLIKQAAEALEHAHSLGIVHRDVKPGILLLDSAGGLWVSDFGLARLGTEGGLTVTGDLLGTLRYMSPEQALGKHNSVDHRTDVYSLGVTLYELLTLRPAFTGADREELLRQVTSEEPLPPRRLGGTIPEELETIVLKAMSKEPGSRYPTAGALAADLERWLSGEPIHARPVSQAERVWRQCRRNPVVSSLLAAVVLVAAGGFVGVLSQWQIAIANGQKAITYAAAAQVSAQEAKDQAQVNAVQRDEVKALNDKLRHTLYIAHVNMARYAWEAFAIDQMIELLDQHRPKPGETDLRGFEWHYLHRLCHMDPHLTLKGHTRGVNCVAFSPDGSRVASASSNLEKQEGKWVPVAPEVKVWDAATGLELFSLKAHTGEVKSVAFSPDGKRLATGGSAWDETTKTTVAGEVKIWDAQSGQVLLSLKGHTFVVNSVAYSPDGKRLASGSGKSATPAQPGELKIWDAQTGDELLFPKGHTDVVANVAFNPAGTRLASSSWDNTARVWDAEKGEQLLSVEGGWGGSIGFSPDGKRLASGHRVYDTQTGKALVNFDLFNAHGLLFSPDGKRLASTSHKQPVRIYDAESGKELFAYRSHISGSREVAFSPDGKRLACAHDDGTVKIWNATTSPEYRALSGHQGVSGVAFSPDGKRVVTAGRQGILKVSDTQTGRELLSITSHAPNGFGADVAYSPDGKRLASAHGGSVKVWDAETGQELLLLDSGRGGRNVAFSPDGKWLASAGAELKVWDALSGKDQFSVNVGQVLGVQEVAFSPDGKRIACGGGIPNTSGGVQLFDAQTGQKLLFLQEPNGGVQGVAYNPDGKRVASASYGGSVRIWDADSGQELLSLKGHTAAVKNVAYSPDGERLATLSEPLTLKVFDAQTGQETLSLKGGQGQGLAFSPDGHRLAGAAWNGPMIYDATPLPEKP